MRRKISYSVSMLITLILITGCGKLGNISGRSLLDAISAFVVGQDSATTAAPISGFNFPGQTTVVGNKLIAADPGNNRVVIWNNFSAMTSLEAPSVVLGQSDKGRTGYGTQLTATNFAYPFGVASDGTKLFVSDVFNARVLVWNTIPTVDNTPPDFVLGQPDFESNTAALTQSGLLNPYEIHVGGGKLLVGDYSNRRVMIWNLPITANNQPADLVLGQPNFTTLTYAVDASTSHGPDGVWTDGTKVLMADYRAHRVMIWNTFPTANGQAADLVLGQANFATAGAATTSTTMFRPWDVKSDGTRIAVADSGNQRVLVWTSWPTANGQAADVVLGQPNFTSSSANQGLDNPTGQTMYGPTELFFTADHLLVSDANNNRILKFDLPTLASNVSAVGVVGQESLLLNKNSAPASGTTNTNLSGPTDSVSDGTRLAVADCNNNRVLLWNEAPLHNEAADFVLGQPDMISSSANNGGVSAKSLKCPISVAFVANKLYVVDNGNNRVLIYNTFPQADFVDADAVIGQIDFISNAANAGGISGSTFSDPRAIFTSGTKLAISDSGNNRVLIWNNIPSSNVAADLALGQPNLTSNAGNNGGISASTFYYPEGKVWLDGTKVVVADAWNNRVLVWNSWPTSSGQAADTVIGQQNMTSTFSTANSFEVDVKISDSSAHQVSFYAVDWDSVTRGFRVEVLNANDELIDSRDVTTYNAGVWYKWNVRGRVKFRIQAISGSNGIISGIFFDPVSSGSVPSSNGVSFVGTDVATQGTWIGTYGSEGYKLAQSATSLPAYATDVVVSRHADYTWLTSSADVRAMQNATGTDRMATCWYTSYSGRANNWKFYNPTGVVVSGNKLLVADRDNHRILVWNSVPTSNGAAADAVLGQSGFFMNSAGYGVFGFNRPTSFDISSNVFFVTDKNNNRIVGYPMSVYSQFD